MLEHKVALVYGAGGPVGGAVARAFAREGARVFLAGRTQATLDMVAADIRANGGRAATTVLDALNEQEVNDFVDRVAAEAGAIDISFNLISYGDVQKPLMELSVDEFLQPIVNAMRTHFLTTKAAVRHMSANGGGVILLFGGGGPQTVPGIGGFKVALDALESMRRQWAIESGKQGVRVVTIKTGGIPESISDDLAFKDVITTSTVASTFLGRAATLADVGNIAVFAASDQARMLTSTDINISGGAIVD